MSGFVSIQAARDRPGLRLVLLQALPSPWSQAAKGILEIKKIPYTRVTRTRDDPPDALEDWTGQASFPAAMLDDERPRSGWAEILLLAERLEPSPPLIPADPAERARCFGLAHEICGEMGLGWCGRLMAIDAGLAANPQNPISKLLGDKYGYRPAAAAAAPGRVVDVLRLLSRLLAEQRAAGRSYLLGADLSAVDVYWATFCNLLSPLPPDLCRIPDALRPMFTAKEPEVVAALDPILLEHRDLVYERHLTLPVEL